MTSPPVSSLRPLAIVFGGSRGIGAACVEALVADGFDVALTYVSDATSAAALADRASSGGARVRSYAVDVREAAAVTGVFAKVAADFGGPVHAVVANAGINVPPGPIGAFPAEDFRRLMEVNVVGAFNILKESAQHVADGGAIVALTTSLVRHAAPGLGAYSASKAAVECMLRSMSKELAPRGVRVNGVAPGPVDTDLFNAGKTDAAKQGSAAMSPFKRIGQPGEVASVVAFLLSGKASWISGQVVQPNGALV
jgi:3-oxoacyl-[acyl-carrier protein] reductase